MAKDFDRWNKRKKSVDGFDPSAVYFAERQIWWCSLGANVGHEQDGKGTQFSRPVVIFKKFTRDLFWAIPLTTRTKEGNFYLPVSSRSNKPRIAILPQLRLLDSKRLIKKIDSISAQEHGLLKEKIIAFIR